MSRLLCAVLAVVIVLLALGEWVAADGPEVGPFPYAELAALSAAEAAPRVRVAAAEGAAVRLRPALGWSVVAEVEAGDALAALAITPGLDPWLRVALPSGGRGWIRLADVDAPDLLVAGLVQRSAPVLLAASAAPVGPGSGCIGLRVWPGGPADDNLCATQSPLAVAGRSPDSEWIALHLYRYRQPPEVAWASAAETKLSAPDVTASDLPVFVGRGTTLVPAVEGAGGQSATLPEAADWVWTPDNQLVGVGEYAIWRYDPQRGTLETYPRPAGDATIAPDGAHAAVASCSNAWAQCGKPPDGAAFDIVIVPTDGGDWRRVRDAYNPILGEKFGTPYAIGEWSPDGQALLAAFTPRYHEWPGFAVEYSVIDVSGERYPLPRLGEGPRQYWVWLADGTLLLPHNRWSRPDRLYVVTRRGALLREIELSAPAADYRWFRTSLGHPWAPLNAVGWSREDNSWHVLDLRTGATTQLQILDPVDVFGARAEGRRISRGIRREGRAAFLLFDGASGAGSILDLPSSFSDTWRPVGEWGVGHDQYIQFAPSGGRLLLRGVRDETHSDVHIYVVELGSGEWIEADLRDGYGCGERTHWSPDGEQFTVAPHEFYEQREDKWWYRRDGLTAFAFGDIGSQIRIYDRAGKFVRAFRTLGGSWENSAMEAKWSPDGQWLALGGRTLEPFECSPGH